MSEQRSGYFYIQPIRPNVFSTASLAELVEQIEACGYRCEAGPLENNLAFIELKERVKEPAYEVVEVEIHE